MSKKKKDSLRYVKLERGTILDFPELWLSVYLAGEDDRENSLFRKMFMYGKCHKADYPDEADLVVFGGGSDVDPALYGEPLHSSTLVDKTRDKNDIELYNLCYDLGIPMLGICRGAQFLHVMNGGTLFQDADGHYAEHSMYDEENFLYVPTVSSSHHQMVRKNTGMEVIATSQGVSNKRRIGNDTLEKGRQKDIEAFFYPETCCIGVQGHPEYPGYSNFLRWTLDLIKSKVIDNKGLEKESGLYRVDETVIKNRIDRRLTRKVLKELS